MGSQRQSRRYQRDKGKVCSVEYIFGQNTDRDRAVQQDEVVSPLKGRIFLSLWGRESIKLRPGRREICANPGFIIRVFNTSKPATL
jgi:hypothetical protein